MHQRFQGSTKHKGLPKKVKQEIVKRLKQEQKVDYPQVGNYNNSILYIKKKKTWREG